MLFFMNRNKRAKRANVGGNWLVTYEYVGLKWCKKMGYEEYSRAMWNDEIEIIHAKKIG